MAINDTRPVGYLVTSPNWNEVANAINRLGPPLKIDVTSLDANSSIVLPTTEETDLDLDAGGGGATVNVNGMTVPNHNPWSVYLLLITNNTVVLKHESGSQPTPAKRFWFPDGADKNITPGGTSGCILRYRVTSLGSRWVGFGV